MIDTVDIAKHANDNTSYSVGKKQGEVKIYTKYRSSRPEVFVGKGALKIRSKFTGEHPCGNAISIKLLYQLY